MKKYLSVLSLLAAVASMLLFGCSSDNSTNPSAGSAKIEGQFVADAGVDVAARSLRASNASGTVYPVSGATVQLIQDGNVVATATTDAYGRFQFTDLAVGEYDVRMLSGGEAVAHYHAVVTADQTLTVYGRVVDGDCLWDGEYGSNWNGMTQGAHWGNGFQGASPGNGYWHDGQEWCDGTGPHGNGGSQNS
jgi:hypothetical protein